MPRKKLVLMPGWDAVDCFAFSVTKSGKPECTALTDIYCLKEDKPCAFKSPPVEIRG